MIKFIAWAIGLLLLVVVSLTAGAYFLLTPERTKPWLVKALEDDLPGSKVSLEGLDYSFGKVVTLQIKNLMIKDKANDLVTVKKIDLKLPIWSMLTEGAMIDFSVEGHLINLTHLRVVLNRRKTVEEKREKKDYLSSLPDSLKKSGLTLRLADGQILSVNGGTLTNLAIKELIFKADSLLSEAIVNLDSTVVIDAPPNNLRYSLGFKTSFSLPSLLKSQEFKANGQVSLSTGKLTGQENITFPDFSMSYQIESDMLEKHDIKLMGEVLASKMGMELALQKDALELRRLKVNLEMHELIGLVPGDKRKGLRTKNLSFLLEGKGKISQGKADLGLGLLSNGELGYQDDEGNQFELSSLDLKLSNEGKYAFQVDAKAALKAGPEMALRSTAHGTLDLSQIMHSKEIKASIDFMLKNILKLKGKEVESTSLGLKGTVEGDAINVENLSGKIVLEDFKPLVQGMKIKAIKKLQFDGALLKVQGKLKIQDKKFKTAQISLKSENPFSVGLESGTATIKGLDFALTELNQDMLISYKGNAQLAFASTKLPRPLSLTSELSGDLDGKRLLEEKKIKFAMKTETKWGRSILSARIEKLGSITKVRELDLSALIDDFLAMLPASPELKDLSVGSSTFKAKGHLVLDNEFREINMEFGLSSPVSYRLPDGINSQLNFQGKCQLKGCEITAKAELLSGQLKIKTATKPFGPFDKLSLASLFPSRFDVGGEDLKYPVEKFRKILYAESKPGTTKTIPPSLTDPLQETLNELPPFLVNIDLKNLHLGKQAINASGDINFSKEKVYSENLAFSFGAGSGQIQLKKKFMPKTSLTDFSFTIKRLPLNAFDELLPEMLQGITGNFDGNIKGTINATGMRVDGHFIDYNLKATQGEMKNFNLASFFQNMPLIKGQDLNVSEKFQSLELVGGANKKLIHINSFIYSGLNNTSSITGRGHVGQLGSNENSEMNLVYKDLSGKVTPMLQKNLGLDHIPLRLIGKETDLKPDYKSAVKNLTKNVVAKETEKAKQKVTDELKKKGTEALGNIFKKKK